MDQVHGAHGLPFAFAKRNGVMVGEEHADHTVLLARPGISPVTLAEVRRFLGMPVRIKLIDIDEFDA
ncbi:MAG TPA: type II secretion system protein GspE, partial [Chromatiales bacterium]|nr:type II secretion system protein GspE [Chromatiales bacterium]HEX22359.1 type II secretion system protein GspE [Chromatiales bacterium]